MRISVDRADPGFRRELIEGPVRERYAVTLDGVPQMAVVTADEEAGIVIAHERNDDGTWINDGTNLLLFERAGVVVITREP